MGFIPDLAEMSMPAAGPHIRAIGWLDAKHNFPTGKSSAAFIHELRQLAEKCDESSYLLGWPHYMGFHTCELCGNFRSAGNLGVPAGELLFVTPEMITHYVEHHEYLPPQQFVDAVHESPIPGSTEYEEAVIQFCARQRKKY